MRQLSPLILRAGISLVLLWFGLQQLTGPAEWVGFLPAWSVSLPISQVTFVYLNGWFEIIFGLALLAGFYTRIVSALLALHLFGIAITVGYNSIGVRDFGLAVSTLAIFLHGSSMWSIDHWFTKKEGNNQ